MLKCEIAEMQNRENAEIKRMEGELASACSILAMLRKRERHANLLKQGRQHKQINLP